MTAQINQELLRQVAQRLGGELIMHEPSDWYAKIALASGMELDAHLPWGHRERNQRISFGLASVKYKDEHGQTQQIHSNSFYGVVSPKITVNAAREATAIAKEIDRRLLPGAVLVWEKMLERKASAEEYARNTGSLLARLEKAAGSKARPGSNMVYAGSARMNVQGESVRFESFTVGGELALKILKLLKDEPK